MSKYPIVIIGAGPAGLMAAQKLAENGHQVHIYEQNKAAARKFLVAGHGGFNLTHNEEIEQFVSRYDKKNVEEYIRNFDNRMTRTWLLDLGIPTYVGSSGKIFPEAQIKPIHVLQAWLEKLESLNVKIHYEHKFLDFDQHEVTIEQHSQRYQIPYTKLILALGGESWRKTGSDGKWTSTLINKNITITPLSAANSGYNTAANFQELEGKVLKNIEVKFDSIIKKGELVFTNYGIEGSPLYYLNRFTRHKNYPIKLYIDLKPALPSIQIQNELSRSNPITKVLKEKIKLNTTAIQLLKKLPKEVFTNPEKLSNAIKSYPIEVVSLRPTEEVISTAGGVCFDELKTSLALQKYPNVYCIGEMLDWEAPTGGYLLQACFSMGVWVADHIIDEA